MNKYIKTFGKFEGYKVSLTDKFGIVGNINVGKDDDGTLLYIHFNIKTKNKIVSLRIQDYMPEKFELFIRNNINYIIKELFIYLNKEYKNYKVKFNKCVNITTNLYKGNCGSISRIDTIGEYELY